MITLVNNKVNSCVGLCDACGICAERRDLQLSGPGTGLEAQVRQVVTGVLREVEMYGIDSLKARKAMRPVGVSARHVHVCQEDLEKLFGPGYTLAKERDLLQPGEFASKEKGKGQISTDLPLLESPILPHQAPSVVPTDTAIACSSVTSSLMRA